MMYSLLYQLDIIVKKLTSELTVDYINFFDTTPHATGREEHKRYRIWWSNMDIEGESYGTVEERRNLAVKYINNGKLGGKADKNARISAIKQADKECGSCGC